MARIYVAKHGMSYLMLFRCIGLDGRTLYRRIFAFASGWRDNQSEMWLGIFAFDDGAVCDSKFDCAAVRRSAYGAQCSHHLLLASIDTSNESPETADISAYLFEIHFSIANNYERPRKLFIETSWGL